MEPINYILDIQSPIQQAMKGYGLARQDIEQNQIMAEREQMMGMRGAAEARAASEFEMRRADAERQRAEAETGQAELMRLVDLGANATSDDYTRAWVANPAIRQDISSLQTMLEGPKLDTMLKTSQDLYAAARLGNVDAVRNQLTLQLEAAKNSGDEGMTATYGSALDLLNTNPEAAMQTIGTMNGLTILGIKGPEYFKAVNENLGVGQVETADVQKADNIGGIAVVTTMTDGTVQIKDARTNEVVTGPAADKLLAEASDIQARMAGAKAGAAATAELEAKIDLGRVAAAETEMGAKAVQLGIDAFSRIGLVNANIANLDRAIQLVEEEGANTGVIASRLPSWSDATIELNNMQNTLGLDVIGSVTFGALSEGELALALQTALPTNLTEKALADWLRTKKAAQKKLVGYLTQQAEFFSTGRGPDQWLAFVRSGQRDVNKWMRENPLGRGTAAPTTAAPTGGRLKFDENGDPIP
jgi:hypothetical protein